MAGVDDHSEPVHLGDPLPAERRQAAPARLAGGRIGELVGSAVHRPRHPHAQPVEGGQKRQILAERPAVLDALEGYAPALRGEPQRLVGGGGEADPARIGGDHPLDRHRPHQRRVAGLGIAFGRKRALPCIDDEEAAIEPARVHPRQVYLAVVPFVAVAPGEIPARHFE